jgi:hypothetical protein
VNKTGKPKSPALLESLVIREFELLVHRGGICGFLDATLIKGLLSAASNDITFTHLLPGIVRLHIVRVANTTVRSGLVLVNILDV